jgi:hypothetical protein
MYILTSSLIFIFFSCFAECTFWPTKQSQYIWTYCPTRHGIAAYMCWGKTKVRFLITMEGPKAVKLYILYKESLGTWAWGLNNGLWTSRCDSGIVFSAGQELSVALFCRGFRISTFGATSFEILKELYFVSVISEDGRIHFDSINLNSTTNWFDEASRKYFVLYNTAYMIQQKLAAEKSQHCLRIPCNIKAVYVILSLFSYCPF